MDGSRYMYNQLHITNKTNKTKTKIKYKGFFQNKLEDFTKNMFKNNIYVFYYHGIFCYSMLYFLLAWLIFSNHVVTY